MLPPQRPVTILATALRLWLVVSLWPTPLPWIHRHAEADHPRLVMHLQEYHHAPDCAACEGWHLHFAPLWRLAQETEPEEDPRHTPPNEQPVTPRLVSESGISLAQALSAPAPVALYDAALVAADASMLNQGRMRHAPPTAFLSTYAASIAPHQLIGVLLC